MIVAGDVAPEKVVPLVEKHFGKWKRGSYAATIPQEPPPAGPVYAHVPWQTQTLPMVSVAFHGPAFSPTSKEWAAANVLYQLSFGETSDLYRKLVVEEQLVDALSFDTGPRVDPALFTVTARLKKAADCTLLIAQQLSKPSASSIIGLIAVAAFDSRMGIPHLTVWLWRAIQLTRVAEVCSFTMPTPRSKML